MLDKYEPFTHFDMHYSFRCRSHLRTWLGYTRLMQSKKELRDLEKQKEKSSAKVGQFLLNLQTLKKQLEQDRASVLSRKTTTPRTPRKVTIKKPENQRSDYLVTAPSSVERLSPLSRERGCLGHGDPGLVDEAGHPLVSIREAATIVADFRGTLTQTAIQRSMLSDQHYKLKDQQREIDAMEQMKQELQLGRAITNLDLYRSLIFKGSTSGSRRSKTQTTGLRKIYKNEVIAMKFKEVAKAPPAPSVSEPNTDFSNLRGQAPVVTRRKELRNIIVPQEEIRKANKEFWRHHNADDDEYDSESSEPELKKLFQSDLLDDSLPEVDKESCYSEKKRAQTPPFLVQMRKRQEERAEKREEIRKYHELREAELKRQSFEAEAQRLQQEEEQKIAKRKKLRALIKAERHEKRQRQQDFEKFQLLNRRAVINNETRLLKRYGLDPWKQLIQEKRINEIWAEKHFEKHIKKQCLQDWIHWTKSNQIMRRVKAEEFERQKLLTNSLGKWMEVMCLIRPPDSRRLTDGQANQLIVRPSLA